MMITYRQLDVGGDTTNATSRVTNSVTTRPNELCLAAVVTTHASAAPTPTITNWTQVATVTFGASVRVTILRFQSATVFTGTLTIDFGGVTATGSLYQIVGFESALVDNAGNGAGAIGQAPTNTATAGTALTISYGTAWKPGSAGYTAQGRNANAAMGPRTNWTEVSDAGYNAPTTRMETQQWTRGDADTAAGTTDTTDTRGGVAVEILASYPLIESRQALQRRRLPLVVR